MDDGMRHLRVRFSGVGQEEYQGSNPTKPVMPPRQQGGRLFGRGEPSTGGEEYDAAYAATVAAVAYAIAAREEDKAPSRERSHIPEKTASRKKQVAVHVPGAAPPLELPPRRGESLKRPAEGSMISRWFSGKEILEDGDDDEQRANVSVRRPVKPAQRKPEGMVTPGQSLSEKVVDTIPNLQNDPRKRSRRFEQEQAKQKATVPEGFKPTASFPRDQKKESRRYEQEPLNPRAPPTGRPSGVAYSSEADAMAAAWEKEKLAKIKKKYNETMQTIAEWEDEKKAKAMRQKEPREGDSESKRAKALEEYNAEMRRINKVAAASRLTTEEKKRNAEGKVREKAVKIRSTGKLPRSFGCF